MTDRYHRPASDHVAPSTDAALSGLPDVVARIVETMQLAGLESVVLTKGDFHLELKTKSNSGTPAVAVPSTPAETSAELVSGQAEDNVHVITSPMIGTFYVSPAPGEPPFVQPGDTIVPDQVIGIVEAMKVMNEIAADRGGTVIEIVAEDAETVEYGSPLVRLKVQP